jgi:non-heme chloroperoxidase
MSNLENKLLEESEDRVQHVDGASQFSRRTILIGGAAVATSLALPLESFSSQHATENSFSRPHSREDSLDMLKVKDGTSIYYKDWGTGQPIVFSHGWPLTADAWDAQMLFFGEQGYRVIAHDRRGHGRSGQSWNGNDMDTYAEDLSELIEKLNLKDTVLVGHSTGGGEVARYLGRHGSKRVSKAVLISAVTPFMLGTPDHPGAPMLGSVKGELDSIKAFSETDFREDLKKITVPTLVLQGDDDQIVPLQISSPLTAKLVKNSTLKIYPGQPHGLCTTFADQVNADVLAFIKG